jgi:recombination protein RecA
VGKTNTALVFINQLRPKIGVMYGNPETTAGGRALAYYASLRLDIRRTATNKVGEEAVSNTVRVKAAKNRLGAPYRDTEVPINFGRGFDKYGSLVKAGVSNGTIERNGAWYSAFGERLGQGEANAALALETSDELYNKVYAEILAKDQQKGTA